MILFGLSDSAVIVYRFKIRKIAAGVQDTQSTGSLSMDVVYAVWSRARL